MAIKAPPSKSIMQRVLILASLADSKVIIDNPALCDDSQYLSVALEKLGTKIDRFEDRWIINPAKKLIAPEEPLDCGEGGTTLRFLAALSLVVEGTLHLKASNRLGKRPLKPLFEALAKLGITVTSNISEEGPAFFDLAHSAEHSLPTEIVIDCAQSSQFFTALLMVAPRLPTALKICASADRVSWPYVKMTAIMMSQFGSQVSWPNESTAVVAPGRYLGQSYHINGDWSGASMLLAAAHLLNKNLDIDGLIADGVQSDQAFTTLLSKINQGCTWIDLKECPDLLPALAVCSLFSSGITVFTNIAHTELKESPRASVLAYELSKLGAKVIFEGHELIVEPNRLHGGVTLDPRNDHRLAMAFGLVSLRLEEITVLDPECVNKSYGEFWTVLSAIRSC